MGARHLEEDGVSDEVFDLSKAMRLMYAARAVATGPPGDVPVRHVYFDIRNQARAGLPRETRNSPRKNPGRGAPLRCARTAGGDRPSTT
jgi:hypothetical protein